MGLKKRWLIILCWVIVSVFPFVENTRAGLVNSTDLSKSSGNPNIENFENFPEKYVHSYYLPYFSTVDGDWTGLALANSSQDNQSSVSISVYNRNGQLLENINKTIDANGQTSFTVPLEQAAQGWMQVDSSQQLTGLAFLGSGKYALMADIPFVNKLSTNLTIPHIAQDDIWDTTILVCNPQDTPVTIKIEPLIYNIEKEYIIPAHGSRACPPSNSIFADKGIAAFALYTNIKSGGSYYAGINAVNKPVTKTRAQTANFVPPSPLLDTGQTACYDNTGLVATPTPGQPFYGQDAQYQGLQRSYTKLNVQGNELPVTAISWSMVRDNVTGLIWEVKNNRDQESDFTNPHDADNLYFWYDNRIHPSSYNLNGNDTEDFIKLINNASFGGHSDWRLPTISELATLIHSGTSNPSIDTVFFPKTICDRLYPYLSSSLDYSLNYTWVVYFGHDKYVYERYWSLDVNYGYARAVRSGRPFSFAPMIDNGNGTVTDPNTGLMWQQATGGKNINWQVALNYCENLDLAGFDDWRLPNHNELRSLVDYDSEDLHIDKELFPDTSYDSYWSSTTSMANNSKAITYCFCFAANYPQDKQYGDNTYVRAVRNVQYNTQKPKVVSLAADPTLGTASLPVTFYCATIDPDGKSIIEYRWDFDYDGTIDKITKTNLVEHTYHKTGTYFAICAIRYDKNQESTSRPVTIYVRDPNDPEGSDPSYKAGPYDYYVPSFMTNKDNWTGLALSNEGDWQPATLNITVFDNGGTDLREIKKFIPADGLISFPITTDYPTKGWLHINSNQPLSGLAFIGNQKDAVMADVPFTDKLANRLVIPHIANDKIWETTILVCNPQPLMATVTFTNISPNGTVAKSVKFNVPARGSGSFSLADHLGKSLDGKLHLESTRKITAFAIYDNLKSGGKYYAGINASQTDD